MPIPDAAEQFPRKGRVTLRDVAALSGVHASTVSKVLSASSETGRIPPVTVDRVLDAARTLGYRPNLLAASLRTSRSFAVGIIVTDISNPTIPMALLAIEKVLAPLGFISVLAHVEPGSPSLVEDVNRLLDRQLDGMILASSATPDIVLDACARASVPTVLMFGLERRPGLSAVIHDERSGVALLADHLLSLGHRRIAHIAGPQALSTGRSRHAAFLEIMASAGLRQEETPVEIAAAYTREAGRAACVRLLGSHRPTAILAAHDLLALGCLDVFRECGVACPAEISVTGFDDIPNMDLINPSLTTVRLDFEGLGNHAAHLLLNAIDGAASEGDVAILQPRLMVRGSTSAI